MNWQYGQCENMAREAAILFHVFFLHKATLAASRQSSTPSNSMPQAATTVS